jgi:acetylornithine deacetylase/succinyl-diaminopimelate desuccinylase family protein
MVDEAAVRAAVAAVDADQVVAFARRLIAAPSENPGGTEHEAAAVAAEMLQPLGASMRTVESPDGRPNLIATFGGTGPKLVWNGHLDVVPVGEPSGWPYPPFDGVVEGGVLHGRGAADMKGAVGAALGAVAAIRRAGVAHGGTLELHLVADEEHLGTHGTRVLREHGLLDADACIVGEPTRLDIALAERGGAWVALTAKGRGAHGSTPDLGVNAITSMARVLLRLHEVLPDDGSHPLVGRPSVNAALIAGGTAPNVVPDRCVVDVDRRTIPGEARDDVLAAFDRVIASVRDEHPETDVEVELREWTEAAETDPADPFVAIVRDAVTAERGRAPEDTGLTGISDARFYLNDAHVPTVILGPGDLRVAHTHDERVEVDELVTAARIYARIFLTFLGSA